MAEPTITDPFYYMINVEGEGAAQASLDTAAEAMDYAKRRVYLNPERLPDQEALLRDGQIASWFDGFAAVAVIPVKRRVL